MFSKILIQIILSSIFFQLGANGGAISKHTSHTTTKTPSATGKATSSSSSKSTHASATSTNHSHKASPTPSVGNATLSTCASAGKRDDDGGDRVSECNLLSNMPWHLQAIMTDDFTKSPWPTTKTDTMRGLTFSMKRDPRWGAGNIIYLICSGVNPQHPAFQKNQVLGGHMVSGGGTPHDDQLGTGTAMASVAVGWEYGIAPSAAIFPIKIAVRTSKHDDMVKALEVAIADWTSPTNKGSRAIIGIGIMLVHSPKIKELFERAIAHGMHIVTSAGPLSGRSGEDMCYDPQNGASTLAPGDHIVVGGFQPKYHRKDSTTMMYSSASNHGSCIDFTAPSEDIYVANKDPNPPYVRREGIHLAAAIAMGMFAAAGSQPRMMEYGPKDFKSIFLEHMTKDEDYLVVPGTTKRRAWFKKMVLRPGE